MDPRAAVAQARQLGLGPPPRKPAAAEPVPADDDDDTPEPSKRGGRPRTAPRAEKRTAARSIELPGFTRGTRRTLTVSLPRATLAALRAASRDSSMGATVVEALRASYGWLVETHKPKATEAVGPFPPPVRPRRRRKVDDPTPVHLYVSPDEARAVAQVADECELSMSELVTLGVDHYLAERVETREKRAPAERPARERRRGTVT